MTLVRCAVRRRSSIHHDAELCIIDVNNCDPKFRNSSLYSRLQQYFRQALDMFERIRVIHDYRTPASLRSYALVYLTLYPLIFAPQFALYASRDGLWAGCVRAVVVVVVVVVMAMNSHHQQASTRLSSLH